MPGTTAASAVILSAHGAGASSAAVLAMQTDITEIEIDLTELQTEIDTLNAATGVTGTIDGGTF